MKVKKLKFKLVKPGASDLGRYGERFETTRKRIDEMLNVAIECFVIINGKSGQFVYDCPLEMRYSRARFRKYVAEWCVVELNGPRELPTVIRLSEAFFQSPNTLSFESIDQAKVWYEQQVEDALKKLREEKADAHSVGR